MGVVGLATLAEGEVLLGVGAAGLTRHAAVVAVGVAGLARDSAVPAVGEVGLARDDIALALGVCTAALASDSGCGLARLLASRSEVTFVRPLSLRLDEASLLPADLECFEDLPFR